MMMMPSPWCTKCSIYSTTKKNRISYSTQYCLAHQQSGSFGINRPLSQEVNYHHLPYQTDHQHTTSHCMVHIGIFTSSIYNSITSIIPFISLSLLPPTKPTNNSSERLIVLIEYNMPEGGVASVPYKQCPSIQYGFDCGMSVRHTHTGYN